MLLLRGGYRRDRGRRPVPLVGWSSAIKCPEIVCQRLTYRGVISIYSIPNPDPPYVVLPPVSVRYMVKVASVGISSGQLELMGPLPPIHLLSKIQLGHLVLS